MQTCAARAIDDPAAAFYADALQRLEKAGIPHLIGGAFAFARYTGIDRPTKDLDIFVRPEDCRRVLRFFAARGYRTELPFPHWLGKVHRGAHFMDIIFSSGNGVARVDDGWFTHAVEAELFGVPVALCPPEEMMWSKAFVQERERFDGSDVIHLMRALGPSLDWRRLLARFGDHWRVLFAHLVTFGYVYPDQRTQVPEWVAAELAHRLIAEGSEPENRVCNGTLLSREQYLVDLERLGYRDARTEPNGPMTREEADIWTAAIEDEKDSGD
jgi:hypothetical protein